MSDVNSIIVPVMVAGTVNVIAKIKDTGIMDSINVVFANAALLATLAGVGQFVDWELATLLAVLYLIATMLSTGLPVIKWFTKLVEG
jgi:hypothetical protein